jgi:hypothetical protein
MNELDKLIVVTAATITTIYLIGPAAVWRIVKTVAEWALVITVFVWML